MSAEAVGRSGRDGHDRPPGVSGEVGSPSWGSDLIVALLRKLGIEYMAVMPGSTTRGIHDSTVNWLGNQNPQLILCNHEMVAASVGRGYARVTGKPMAVLLHNVVGLLNAEMTIFDAWYDRVPMLILGGTGPMDASRRRPDIDWRHTALIQGNLVRDFTKWDDQPASLAAIPETILRGYRMSMTEPMGPVYLCFDVDLQEQAIDEGWSLPDIGRYAPGQPPVPDQPEIRRLAEMLVESEAPTIVADLVGRKPEGVEALVELAELVAAPVVDMGERQNFPMPHALNFTAASQGVIGAADLVLGLDAPALVKALKRRADSATRTSEDVGGAGQRVATISLDEYLHRGWSTDYHALPAVDLPMLGDTAATLPLLIEECGRLIDEGARRRIEDRRGYLDGEQARLRERQRKTLDQHLAGSAMTEIRLMAEIWNAVRDQDYVFTGAKSRLFTPGTVELNGPDQFIAGGNGGGAIGAAPGLAVGAALALRDSGKLPISVIGDGNMLSGIQAMWTASHYELPSLWVVNNNRSYFNDEEHQRVMAEHRGRPEGNHEIGIRIEDPEVDFAGVARGFDLSAEGPIRSPDDLSAALKSAVPEAKERTVVLDVWTDNRKRG